MFGGQKRNLDNQESNSLKVSKIFLVGQLKKDNNFQILLNIYHYFELRKKAKNKADMRGNHNPISNRNPHS